MGFLKWVSDLLLLLLLGLSGVPIVYGNAELRALMEMKSSLDPDSKLLTSWTSDGDPCRGMFYGVACNGHRKVANISLQGMGLHGQLSPAVAELKCLSGLYLHYNHLTGEIPKEIANLGELTDLYIDVNNLSGRIPPEIGDMASLEVLQLGFNQLIGNIPTSIGSLKKLSALALQHNRLDGPIPSNLGNLGTLKRIYLSFNNLSGPIPERLADIPLLEMLDVRNNSLAGPVPPSLKSLNGGFHGENNSGLCGTGFLSLRNCTAWDNSNTIQPEPSKPIANFTAPKGIPISANFHGHCNRSHCPSSSKLEQVAIVAGGITVAVLFMIGGFLLFIGVRRRNHKISNTIDPSVGLSPDQTRDFSRKSTSPLVSLEYRSGWDPLADKMDGYGVPPEFPAGFKFNVEDVELATQYFSEVNLLGKSKLFTVYKGILKDGSIVAIKSINVTCCKSEEAEFMKGLSLLTSLRHENLVKLRGFCCSMGRGECFLIYDFASKGSLSEYLDLEDGSSLVLDWTTRVSIINGIAKGVGYLHSEEPSKPGIVHQNISAEKILLNDKFDPLISDAGLLKLLANDAVFSALKVSAALGYMAPEYITTGRFTEKSDVYAFGVIILQILFGKSKLTYLMRLAAESGRLEECIDPNLMGNFTESEAVKITRIALDCTQDLPDQRPTMEEVIEELSK